LAYCYLLNALKFLRFAEIIVCLLSKQGTSQMADGQLMSSLQARTSSSEIVHDGFWSWRSDVLCLLSSWTTGCVFVWRLTYLNHSLHCFICVERHASFWWKYEIYWPCSLACDFTLVLNSLGESHICIVYNFILLLHVIE